MTMSLVFKALSDSTRREILRLLEQGDLPAGEIAGHFEMTKPSISHHLNVLKQADLVQDLRQGQNIYYSLNTTVFQEILSWLVQVLGNRHGEQKDINGEKNIGEGAEPKRRRSDG